MKEYSQYHNLNMRYILLTILFIASSQLSNAQDLFFIGSKSYPSTGKHMLYPSSYSGKILEINIAKKGEGGIIALSTESMLGTFIRGKAIIYLDNGSQIYLIDRGIYDKENNIATTVYYLTPGEIEILKQSNINTIRFTIKCGKCVSASDEGNYSVANNNIPVYGKRNFSEFVSHLFE